MRTIQALNGKRRGANVFVILPICALLLLPGCRNVLESRDAADTGTLSLTINRQDAERTIMPDVSLSSFSRFELYFVRNANCVTSNANMPGITWTGTSSGTITLAVGIWDLHVTAFLAGTGLEAASAIVEGIVVASGGFVSRNVRLLPIPGGTGTFSWDIGFSGENFAESIRIARMEILQVTDILYGIPGAVHRGTYFFVDDWGWGDGTITPNPSSLGMNAGHYHVIFTVYNNNWERVVIREVLHVYHNMESRFSRTFSINDFPVTLRNYIAGAWDGSSWNFAQRGIMAEHFSIVGIRGVYDSNFSDIVRWFNVLQNVVGESVSLEALVDAALVGIASDDPSFRNAASDKHRHRGETEVSIAELLRNGHTPSIIWEDGRTIDVWISQYVVRIYFTAEIPMPSPPQPGDRLADQLAYLRFNATHDGTYDIVISGTEDIRPLQAAMPVGWSGLTISISGDGPSIVNLASNGSLFTLSPDITLVLGNNVTLHGRAGNDNPLIQVNGGRLVMNDGARIINNANVNATCCCRTGGGVHVNFSSTFDMLGGEISGNTTTHSWSGVGGGVRNLGTFNMRGGTISGNTASALGGGVWNSGTFNMSNGVIYGIDAEAELRNTAGGAAAFYNIGTLARYGVFTDDGEFVRNGDLRTMGFTVRVVNGHFHKPDREGGVAAQLVWLRYLASGDRYTIEVSEDEYVEPQLLYFGRPITVAISGTVPRTLNLASPGALFSIGRDFTLELGNNITLQGRENNNSPLVQVNWHGRLVMNDGARIVNNINTNAIDPSVAGGGVNVNHDGTFTMYGGEISGNIADNNGWTVGGGVFINWGTFNMRGGVISGNATRNGGGGVFSQNATFRMSNGIIYGNDAEEHLMNTTDSWEGAAFLDWGGISEYGTFNNGDFVRAGYLHTSDETIRVVNGVRPPGDLTLSLAAFREIGTDIIGDLTISILDTAQLSATITVLDPAQYHSIRWFIGTSDLDCCCRGNPVSGEHNETITLNSGVFDNRPGAHFVTVEVLMGAALYSRRIAVTVVP